MLINTVKTKKITLIGLGSIGEMYLEVLKDIPGAYLVSVVEPFPKKPLKETLRKDVEFYSALKEMLAGPDRPDMAIICTPPNTHSFITEECLKAGIDCLVEKPVTMTLEDGEKLYNLAQKLGRKVVASAKYKVSEPLLEIQSRLQKGDIGKLKSVECTFTSQLDVRQNWRSNPSISGGGVWMDNGPHAIVVVESVAGKIRKIRIDKCDLLQKTAVEDEVIVSAEHDNHVTSRIILSWNRQIKAPYVLVTGSKGKLIGDWNETTLLTDAKKETIAGGYDKRAAFTTLVKDFIQGISSDTEGLDTLKCILSGYRSAKTGQWEPV